MVSTFPPSLKGKLGESSFFLDSGLLGLVTNPSALPEALALAMWVDSQLMIEARIVVAELVDFEVRRELLRAKRTKGLLRLDEFIAGVEFLPINSSAMRLAAELWAQARQRGIPTASDTALDGDMILAAQALTYPIQPVIVVTTNVRHLKHFVDARTWRDLE
jgi:predicted nucleic acid-binding protein